MTSEKTTESEPMTIVKDNDTNIEGKNTSTEILKEFFIAAGLTDFLPTCGKKNCQEMHVDKLLKKLFSKEGSEMEEKKSTLIHAIVKTLDKIAQKTKEKSLHEKCKEGTKQILKEQARMLVKNVDEKFIGEFVEGNCKLSKLEQEIKYLSADNILMAREIQAKLDAYTWMLQKANLLKYKENNLVPDKLPGSTYQAYEIARGKSEYLLAVCPKNVYEVGDLFQLVIEDGLTLMVTVFTEGERDNCISNFWQPTVLQELPLRRGWGIQHNSRTLLHGGKNKSFFEKEKTKIEVEQAITEGKISFVNVDGRQHTITHLHLNGWIDQKPCCDEELLLLLLERMEELGGKRFEIGCRHSRSRSATVILCHLLRQEIRNVLYETAMSKKSYSLDEITINIPEIIFQFRKVRSEFLRRPTQMINVYSVTNKFYQRLKEVEKCLLPQFVEQKNCLGIILSY